MDLLLLKFAVLEIFADLLGHKIYLLKLPDTIPYHENISSNENDIKNL